MTEPLSTETLQALRDYVGREVRAGFVPLDEIAGHAVEYLVDQGDAELLRHYAEASVRDAHAAHLVEQAGWPAVTDCDRLDAAFDRLEREGIVARQDFTCCQSCGHAEIDGPMAEASARGQEVRGYTFFHRQDTEAVVDGYGLLLAYGAREGGDEASVAVGTAVVRALSEAGLETDWDGTVEKRIEARVEWRRRR